MGWLKAGCSAPMQAAIATNKPTAPLRRLDSIRRVNTGASRPLHRAFGLDRDLGIGVRRGAAQHPHLLVALLLAGDLDLFRIDLLAEAGNAVGAERVGAGDHAAAILDRHRHLGVGNGRAVGVLDEAEIGGAFVLMVVVVVAETGAAGPQRRRQDAGQAKRHDRMPGSTPTKDSHSRPPVARSPALVPWAAGFAANVARRNWDCHRAERRPPVPGRRVSPCSRTAHTAPRPAGSAPASAGSRSAPAESS